MSFYSEMAAVASELLTEFGQVAYVRVTPKSSSDPAAGTVTEGTAVNTAVNCVVVSITEENKPGGALIESGDQLAILDGQITLQDELKIGNWLYQVADLDVSNPAGTGLVWKAHITGAVYETDGIPDNALEDAAGDPLTFADGEYWETVD